MELGIEYSSMDEFRLAMRQYTINEEFDMATKKSDSKRFRGHYKGEGCHWIIVRRRQDDHKNVKVLTSLLTLVAMLYLYLSNM